MHAFDDAVRFECQIAFASPYSDNRTIVAFACKDFSGPATRKIKQDLVEQSIFAQSTEFH
jgi:hypothetical protein